MTSEELQSKWVAAQQRLTATRPLHSRPVPVADVVWAVLESERWEHARPRRMQSVLEARFAHYAVKVLARDTRLVTQQNVRTGRGLYRLDFVIVGPTGSPRLGIECDGAEFHNPLKDAWRDASVLGEHAVDDVVRIEGKDLHRRPYDVLYLLARLYTTCFSMRGRHLLNQLATPVVKSSEGLPEFLYYQAEPQIDDEAMFDPEELPSARALPDDFMRLAISGRSAHADREWRFRYQCLVAYPEVSIDEWIRREERKTGTHR